MVVMTDNLYPDEDRQGATIQQQQQQQQQDGGMYGNDQAAQQLLQQQQAQGMQSGRWNSEFNDDIADADADAILSSKAQFTDLHTRLQSVNHHLSTIFRAVSKQDRVSEARHNEIAGQFAQMGSQFSDLKGLLSRLDRLNDLENKISSLESEVRRLRGDVTSKMSSSERSIKGLVEDTHQTLHETVKKHAPQGHGRLIAVIVGSQLVLVAGYVYYKKRKSSPKKYL